MSTRDAPNAELMVWRAECLVDAGFPTAAAWAIAADRAYDLHALLSLVDRGCPPQLAARILAPVDGPEHRC